MLEGWTGAHWWIGGLYIRRTAFAIPTQERSNHEAARHGGRDRSYPATLIRIAYSIRENYTQKS